MDSQPPKLSQNFSQHTDAIQIHGGDFAPLNRQEPKLHQCYEADDGLKHLQAHVAPAAVDHVDPPKCHPNTRKAILDEIMDWILISVTRIQWMLWLNGAARAGKSAITRSIVDLCIEKNIPCARFFFSRTDPTRNSLGSLVATLIHQILQSIPDLQEIILPRIEADHLIFTKSLRTQFLYLIFDPLRMLQKISGPNLPTLILIFDGVDEYGSHRYQTELIRIVANFVGSNSFPAIAYFASRAEDHLTTVFETSYVSNITHRLTLDNHYLPDNDIHRFLVDSFHEIKITHPLKNHLPEEWPTASIVHEIVEKSSGQFIYASEVIKFISMPRSNPVQQLEIIRGLRPRGRLTPFAQLDALFRHIFSQIEDLYLTMLILAWFILSTSHNLHNCAEFLGMSMYEIHVALTSLKSVIYYDDDGMNFFYASLPDFLLDRERSQEYYIDRTFWSTRMSVQLFKFLALNGSRDFFKLNDYIGEAKASPELQECVFSFNPGQIDWTKSSPTSSDTWSSYLSAVQKLDFGDVAGSHVYQKQLNVVVRYLSTNYPHYLDKIGEEHKISDILLEIEIEAFTAARLKWEKIKTNLGDDVGETVQIFLMEESKIQEREWATREAELRRNFNQEKEVELKSALEAEREAIWRLWAEREVEIRRDVQVTIERQLLELKAEIRQELEQQEAIERRWMEREENIRIEEQAASDSRWKVREEALRRELQRTYLWERIKLLLSRLKSRL